MTLARKMISPRHMAALAVLLGLCLGKPPEATRLATSPSFGLPRGPLSYMPRKQQRVRVLWSRTLPVPSRRASAGGPHHSPLAIRSDQPTTPSRYPLDLTLRSRAQNVEASHPLRC
jgi:hypothetical protein